MLPSVQTHSGNCHRPCLQTPDCLQDRYGCAGLSRALGMPVPAHLATAPQPHGPSPGPQRGHYPPSPSSEASP